MGSRARTQALHLGQRSLDGLATVIARFIPQRWFAGEGKRQRVYTPLVTFCAFLGQVLQRDASCREAVRRVQVWCHALNLPEPDDNTSGYCQARLRLGLECLRKVHDSLVQKLSRRIGEADLWWGRCVKVIDGCGISMPDTDKNRQVYPYAGVQQPGCGFPTGKLVGLFSLSGGHLIRFVHASWKTHELKLARPLVGWLRPREVLVGDRGFCGWGFIALLKTMCVDGSCACTKDGPVEAAARRTAPLHRISFKGALTAMRQWAPLLHDATVRQRESIHAEMFAVIASDLLPCRPNRVEPRCVKRRPKSY